MHHNNIKGQKKTSEHQNKEVDNIPDTVEDPCHHTPQPRVKHRMALHHCI